MIKMSNDDIKLIVRAAIAEYDSKLSRDLSEDRQKQIKELSDFKEDVIKEITSLKIDIPKDTAKQIKDCRLSKEGKKRWNITTTIMALGILLSTAFSIYAIWGK